MNRYYSILLVITLLFTCCNRKKADHATIKRDTTITPVNAFSSLFLDSTKVEAYITAQKLDDSAATQIRSFYNSRNYQFAWFTEDGLADQTRAFWNLHNNYINYSKDSSLVDKNLHNEMELLTGDDTAINVKSDVIIHTELELTQHFFEYAHYAFTGKLDPAALQWYIPRKKLDVSVLLDSLITRKGKHLEEWVPVNQGYKRLYKELARLDTIEKAGGWKTISFDNKRKYAPGDSALLIMQMKQRLRITGDYASNDTSQYFTTAFIPAVKQAEKRFGFKQDGIIDAALVAALNVPVQDRVRQLLVNMERMRWMPVQPEGNLIFVNIPDFKLLVYEGTKRVFDMNIVVGKAANSTVVFTGNLKYVVFSPYWNVPPSIVKNEILPSMKRNKNYLARTNMEQTGISNGLPVIRQKPGGSNSLGKVKFLFPNVYNIYFHDTPAKNLFNEEKRAFSHGCMRLSDPKKMATYLLRDQPEWTSQAIDDAMNASKEKWVTLKEGVPVFICYFTAWVDREGLLNFRDDIYGHDKEMAAHLFEARSPDSKAN